MKPERGEAHNPFAHGGNLAEVRERFALDGKPLLDFSANINPLGMPDSVRRAILAAMPSLLHYPDTECRRLRTKLAERVGVRPENIIVGNGSTELMFLAARAMLRGAACVIDPTFTEYRHAVEHAGGQCVNAIAEGCYDFRVTGDILTRAATLSRMVFLCNPNNPTGVVTSGAEILSVTSKFPDVLFVIDEAFCDFLPNEDDISVMRSAARTGNLIVLRSLTKFFAIPGLRLGYLVANERAVGQMLRLKEPWTVNSLAEEAGCAAVDDIGFCKRTREAVRAWKDELVKAIGEINGLQPVPPSVNFILTRIVKKGLGVEALQERLLKEGILIRDCSNFPGLDSRYFRVAVRNPQENARLVEALGRVLEESR